MKTINTGDFVFIRPMGSVTVFNEPISSLDTMRWTLSDDVGSSRMIGRYIRTLKENLSYNSVEWWQIDFDDKIGFIQADPNEEYSFFEADPNYDYRKNKPIVGVNEKVYFRSEVKQNRYVNAIFGGLFVSILVVLVYGIAKK